MGELPSKISVLDVFKESNHSFIPLVKAFILVYCEILTT
jgi:hypothetical protein